MTDNRKVLESIPESASLDRTMPAPRTPAEQGKNLGGITQTADSALRHGDDTADSGETPPLAGPRATAPDKRADSSATTPGKGSSAADSEAVAADARTPEDESALESLGRAIGAPLSGEAADKEPRR